MDLITWSDKYSTGVNEVDEQHKKLILFINQLHDAMLVGKGFNILEEILDGLINYTVEHFAYEESVMATKNYAHIEEHKKLHASLIEQIQSLQGDFKNKTRTITVDIMAFLKNWLINHIMHEDIKALQA